MSIYDHPSALTLAAARDMTGRGGEIIRQHVSQCIACRVRAARLQHLSSPGDPSEDSVARILAASAPTPEVLSSMTEVRDQSQPRPGEIWRIGRDEAFLVWIRRVLDGAIDVIPASLDLELADLESVVIPAESTPLGVPLVLLTGVRTHVGPLAMLQRIGYFDASALVREVISAAREDRTPNGVQTGPPIEDDDDERIEYRQVIADLLSDLAPDRWPDDSGQYAGEQATGNVIDLAEIVSMLRDDLTIRHSGCIIRPLAEHRIRLSEEVALSSLTRVSYLDTSIAVVLLDGSGLNDALLLGQWFADAVLEFIHAEPDIGAVAICEKSGECPAVVLKVAQLRSAFEAPGGAVVAPSLIHEPLPLVDALAKYLDKQCAAWETTEPVATRVQNSDFRSLALRSAADAIEEIATQGRRATTPAKKSSWTDLPSDLGPRIVNGMLSIMANEPIDEVLDGMVKREFK